MQGVKRGFRFYVKIYGMIVAQDLKSKMSYRTDFILSIIGMLLSNIAGFISFWILFQNFPSIMGWNYYEMLFFYGFSLLSLTPVQCFFDNNWNLRSNIYSGDFIKYYFRPLNMFFYYESEIFDIKGIGQFIFGIGTIIYAWGKLNIPVTVLSIVLLVGCFISASLFMIALMNVSAALNFWLVDFALMMQFVWKFKDYARYPITIFGTVFRFLFTFVIPIAFITYYPSLFFLRADNIPVLSYLTPVLGIVFLYISYKIWMKGVDSYSGTGS